MPDGLNVVFMGTPDFAVPALTALYRGPHKIPAVVTNPDRPKGRGRKPAFSPVKHAAQKQDLTIFQPESPNTRAFFQQLGSLSPKPDLFVVIAYGHILSQALLDLPPLGAVNLHASLLPQYRGAAPIQRAIMEGETETGITAMQMDTGVDTGDILDVVRIPIAGNDTAETLHDRLAIAAAALLRKTLDALAAGRRTRTPQDPAKASYAPMLTKSDGRIDWRKPAGQIEAFIRAMTPWPGAYTFHNGRRIRIFQVDIHPHPPATAPAPGTVLDGFPGDLRVMTGGGIVNIRELQEASGRRMDVETYLRGRAFPPGTVFT